MQRKPIELECIHCHTRVPLDKNLAGCPNCGENILEARYDLNGLDPKQWVESLRGRPKGLWRYHEVLPLYDVDKRVSLGEGATPLLKARALGAMLGLKHLYIKDERQGPTGSFKDRQATVAISALCEMGVQDVVVASTGNVAIAYSAYGARAGIKVWAFFPSLTPEEKKKEAALYGAEIITIAGSYDETKEVAARFAKEKGIFLDRGIKSVAAIEAMKTMAYEIGEQLGYELEGGERWRAPDWFIQGVSGGMGPIGVGKGFREMLDFGLISKMPAMGIVQSSGCAPMVEAYNNHQRIATPIDNPATIIVTLATGNPGRAYELLYDYVEQYGGHFIAASDKEAFDAIRSVARNEGISVEPATGVSFAGLIKLVQQGVIKPDEVVVINCSGHTMPVESHILGDEWNHTFQVGDRHRPQLPEDKVLDAVMQFEGARRLLIIEDHEDAARLLKRTLEQKYPHFSIETAVNGREGLEKIHAAHPDLVITDLMMPIADGFTVIAAMKDNPALAHIPIIVVTAKELTARERETLSGQVEGVIPKGSVIDDDRFNTLIDTISTRTSGEFPVSR